MTRVLVRSLVVVCVVLTACGGDSASTEAENSAEGASNTTEVASSSETTAAESEASGNANHARVTIGDQVYELGGGLAWVCLKSETLIGGNFVVDVDGEPMMAGLGETGLAINFVVTSPDSGDPQTPFITVEDVTGGRQWQAGEMQGVPESMITDASLVDGVATGTATFFDLAAYLNGEDPELVEGTFEIACP